MKALKNVTQFLGMPFAAAPVGALRWKPPIAAGNWSGVLEATAWPPMCPQLKVGPVHLGQEDCLYVNVIVPGTSSIEASPLPVMLWIYGGAYVEGDGYEFGWYDGSHLAAKEGVIVVSFNYRVGALGFLALGDLLDESGTTGNYGVQDQRLAMRWVQEHIASFGGDASKVTIFGESAGAFSTCYHYASAASAGLFRNAIMESGSCDASAFFQPLQTAMDSSVAYARRLKCTGAMALLECLRSKTPQEILDAAPAWPEAEFVENVTTALRHAAGVDDGGAGDVAVAEAAVERLLRDARGALPSLDPAFPWGPAVDGTLEGLPEAPLAAMERDDFDAKPLLIGLNKNGGTIFSALPSQIVKPTPEYPRKVVFPLTSLGLNRSLTHFFPAAQFPNAVEDIRAAYDADPSLHPPFVNDFTSVAAAAIRDWSFTCASRRAAKAATARGAPVYTYQFSYNISHWLDGKLFGGDYHSSDLSFVFDTQFPPLLHAFDENDKAMSRWVTSRWAQFAKTGTTPNPPDADVAWPKWDPNAEPYLELQLPPKPANHLRSALCDNVWDRLPP